MGVSTTKETANSMPLAATSCLHVDFATILAVTTKWIGNFSMVKLLLKLRNSIYIGS